MAASAHHHAASAADSRTDLVGIAVLVAGLTLLLPGLLAFVSPGAFYDQLAGYAPRNDHFLRDIGAFQIGLGAVGVAAWLRPAMRTPVLGILALHFALHTVSHAIDVNDADPSWQGPFALVFESVVTIALAALFVREVRR